MNTGLRAGLFLWAGLENEILGAYATAPGEISGGGMTQSNAHQLAAQLALDVVCQAWNEVYLRSTWLVKSEEGERAVPCKRQNVGMIYRYRRPLVNMLADQGGGFPLFKREHVPAVADAILHYCGAKLRRVPPGKPRVLPWTGDVADLRHWGLNATAILARIRWENAKVKEQRSRITPPKDQTAENPDIPDPDETLVLKTRGNSRAILLYLWKRGPVSREQLRQAIWKEKKISDRGIDKAVEDLNLRLSLIIETGCKTKVIRNGGVYFLQHPQK
ncbi:MAG: hypothetical protein WCB27_05905 [Thermoguttaceae bacterium]